jgi:hypothetical protein
MLVDISKHYLRLCGQLKVLRHADGGDIRKLRVKAMECAGLIGLFDGVQSVRILAASAKAVNWLAYLLLTPSVRT